MSTRDSIKMTADEVQSFLAKRKVISLASIGADGQPHLVALWYILIDGDVHFWTFKKSLKAVNMRRDTRITAMVEAGTLYNELQGVVLYGNVDLIENPSDIERIGLAMLERYPSDVEPNDALDFVRKQVSARVGARIRTNRIVSWDHTKLEKSY